MNSKIINFQGYPIVWDIDVLQPSREELQIIDSVKNITKEGSSFLSISESSNVFKKYQGLERIEKALQDSFDRYVETVLEIKNVFYMSNSWVVINDNTGHHTHIHTNCAFSAVYYPLAEEGNILFNYNTSKIQDGFNFDYEVINWNEFNSATWRIPVRTGDIVIFPGIVPHEVLPTKGKRVAIGSSFFVKGNIGKENNYNNINI